MVINILFYDNGYLYQNKVSLRYFGPAKEIEICPFIYNDNTCQLFINENEYYTLDISTGLINNEKSYICLVFHYLIIVWKIAPLDFHVKTTINANFVHFKMNIYIIMQQKNIHILLINHILMKIKFIIIVLILY